MTTSIYLDENNQFQFDFSNAVWASNELNSKYMKIHSILSDVDFIVETERDMIFLEYKNTDIQGAVNPTAFTDKLCTDEHYLKIARKYYGSIIYAMASDKRKRYRYVYVLECALAGSTDRLLLRTRIKAKLPFELQKEPEIKMTLIDDFEILSIHEWNTNPLYSQFPISPVQRTTT